MALTDRDMLAGLVAAGMTTVEIARRLDRNVRSVRMALRRHRIDNHNDPRHPRNDLLLDDIDWLRHAHHERGLTVVEIAAEIHRHPSLVIRRLRQADIPTRQPLRHPQLHDAAWLQNQFDNGGTVRSIAASVGCSPSAVRCAADKLHIHRRQKATTRPS